MDSEGVQRVERGEWRSCGSPRWLADTRSRSHLLVGPVQVNPDAFGPDDEGRVFLRSGTTLGRSQDDADEGTPFGPAVATHEHILLLAFDVKDAAEENSAMLVRPGAVVKENLLPEVLDGSMDSGVLDALRRKYSTQRGVA